MNRLTVGDLTKAIYKLEETEGLKTTLLGIGPMSETVIEAVLSLAKEKDFPVMFIASRNQIDSEEFGRGYVRDWDQADFVKAVDKIKARIGFDGLCYICRDHGGPWQRDKERADKLPEAEAMDIAKRSYLADLKAGFDLLHIDPTKDPHVEGVVPMELVLRRTVELIEYVEAQRVKLGIAPIDYEVGTEETNGGLTSEAAYAEFIEKLAAMLKEKKLPMPVFIVGQTGTLVRMTENVGHFNAKSAHVLSVEARKFGVGIKEHNGDYLSDEILCMHPALEITAANVAPEYGMAETEAYLNLASMERKFAELGMIGKPSNLYNVMREAAVRGERWRKWLLRDDAGKTVDEALADEKLSDLILRLGGHYTYEQPEVKAELRVLFDNLKALGLDAHKTAIDYIKRFVRRYVDCFNLEGLTTRASGSAASKRV